MWYFMRYVKPKPVKKTKHSTENCVFLQLMFPGVYNVFFPVYLSNCHLPLGEPITAKCFVCICVCSSHSTSAGSGSCSYQLNHHPLHMEPPTSAVH